MQNTDKHITRAKGLDSNEYYYFVFKLLFFCWFNIYKRILI